MIAIREDINTEFKREYVDDIKLTVLAFANTDGGNLYVGIENDGSVCGVLDPDNDVLRIQNTIRDSIAPDIMMFVRTSFIDYQNKTVIKIEVQRGTKRPYFLRNKGIRPEGVFVRQGPSTVSASYDAIRKMIIETSGGEFEKGVSFEQKLTFDDTANYFSEKQIAFGKPQMHTLGFINQDKLYTNLALLLSDQCPHSLKVAVFQGKRKTIFKDRAEFTGSLLKQLEEAHAFIMRHNSIHSTYQGLTRIDSMDFPVVAVREGLLNAIVHRDYATTGPVLVNIFDDRMEILNQGGLLPNMTVEEVRRGISEQRNKALANFFYRLQLIEAYGTGYDKIDAAYDGSGKTGEIIVTANSFTLILPNINFHDTSKASNTSKEGSLNELPDIMRDRARALLTICREKGFITRLEAEIACQISPSSAYLLLRTLEQKNILVKVGKSRTTQYQIKD